jgi:hypothetical protein
VEPSIHSVNARFEACGAEHIRFCRQFRGGRGDLAHGQACCSHNTHGQLSVCHATYIPGLHVFSLSIVPDTQPSMFAWFVLYSADILLIVELGCLDLYCRL